MRRRDFITLLGGASAAPATWSLPLSAQQPAPPVIGFLHTRSPDATHLVGGLRRGLADTGYVEGQNVTIEYRWADGQYERLPALAADLVRRQVAVIAAAGVPVALAAQAATTTIPVVFTTAGDPVALGLVASLNRPGHNLTGVTNLNVEVGPKRLELLRELIPTATIIALLVNPTSPSIAEGFLRALQPAVRALGLQLHVLNASTDRDFYPVFATMDQLRADALVISPDVFFNTRIERLAMLSLHHAVPAIYQYRPFVAAGGVIGYGSDETEYYRLVGTYTGKILKGEKPADLPVVQSTKVELIINLKTAKALGLTVPLSLLGRADEVIE